MRNGPDIALGTLVILTVVALPALAAAQCDLTAHITAEPSDGELGAYCYTMEFSWDQDAPYGLSHFDLLVDAAGGTCSCTDFAAAVAFDTIAGASDGEGDCTVDYAAFLECEGDPSIPDIGGILFKFEPIEDECEPGNVGSGVIRFYSDLPPVPVDDEVISLVDKAAHTYCYGTTTGVFPGLICDPVDVQAMPWGAVKSTYR